MQIKLTEMYEMLSALHKSIRRGLEQEAGHWFFMIAEGGYYSAAANRLRICSHEDIGLADPGVVVFVKNAMDQADHWHKSKNDAWRLPVSNCILALCRARKSREADHFNFVMRGRIIKGPKKEVPDWAYDKHTQKGRKMGRGWDHFKKEGMKLDPPYHDRYEDECFEYLEEGVFDKKKTEELPFKE